MAIITHKVLQCDSCFRVYGKDSNTNAKTLREDAKSEGWKISKKDICDECLGIKTPSHESL